MTKIHLLLLAFMAVFLSVNALNAQTQFQSTVAAEPIILDKDSTATVLNWFQSIEEKGVVLSYNSARIHLYERVKMKKNTYTIETFLHTLLERYDFETCFVKKKIWLQVKGIKNIQVSGMVFDQNTKEPLEECIVTLETKNHERYAVLTDAHGMFRKTLPSDYFQLKTSYMGYRPYQRTILPTQAENIRIAMVQTAIPLSEVKVKNSPMTDVANYKGASGLLSVNENDPFAQIHALPGILSLSGNGDMHVNGGQNDENLILLDGVAIYHSHHNNALLSQFNGESVEKVSFFDSFIPAQYEGRLSSVTDVKIKGGNSLHHQQCIGLDLPSASLTLDGPIIKQKLTYMVSGRLSWIDFMKDLFSDDAKANRSFNDLTAKIAYQINDKLSVEGMAYRSKDTYKDSINQMENHKILGWENSLYVLSSHAALRNEITNTSSLSFSKYENSIYGPVINIHAPVYINEGMKNITFKSSFTKKLDNYIDLSWGLSASHEKYNLLASEDTVKNHYQHVTQISTYLNSKLKMTDRLSGSVALNFVSYIPKNNEKFFSIQPRFTLKYIVDKSNLFSVDFSRMEQFYHNICAGEIPIPTDLRMPSINGFKPSSSLHSELGWKHVNHHWRASISGFYKRRFQILGIRYQILHTEERGWNRFIMRGNAESYGIKLHSMNEWNRWKLDCSYTFSRSSEWFKDYDSNRKHPTLHDVPHIFHCASSYSVGKHAALSLGGYIKSGTLVNVYAEEGNTSGEFISSRERKKLNYRLDLNYSGSLSSQQHKLQWSYKVGLYNIIGNPKENEVLDLYSFETKKHCLPYFTLRLKL